VTNNSSKNRAAYCAKLNQLGITASLVSDIVKGMFRNSLNGMSRTTCNAVLLPYCF
jgi:hypothetical protein